ncbi:SigE family RNA polymerase sigma factor [Micromonospora sp. DR5-3]|uniref:SigE family RNA polymerase sigma factor n=1 Tax=unclassified Micromonospora TaxID=2617518 RepID=UPI0011D2F8BE|nr:MULTISPECIES: SigE family RNA polymerase sigma factor [unclassified Micromonospora]MCW3818715.1 SigE family RNA polymerase sigma factor [Micromonospora sp. DR5-3]TYC21602.1 SigE family RNA polymerase sigma factor [Micromonospora sp. MP36]
MTFEEYVGSRGPALLRLARLLTGDEHRAEDLTQDVLARAYVHWRKIARADRPDVYVRRMMVNANASWWRRRSSRELAVDSFAEQAHRGDLGGEAADRDEMWRLIRALPDRQRAVLVLRYYEDLDDATIAQILDCSPVTVRTHAMRALAHLRERCGVPTTNGSRP